MAGAEIHDFAAKEQAASCLIAIGLNGAISRKGF